MRLWLMAAVVCLCAVPALAQDKDADGSKDHPMFSRMPGYYIEEYDAQDFSIVELDTDPPKKVEGRFWKISYLLMENARKVGPVLVQSAGIAADRLTTAGFGDTKPVAPNTTDDGRAQNRRVELVK